MTVGTYYVTSQAVQAALGTPNPAVVTTLQNSDGFVINVVQPQASALNFEIGKQYTLTAEEAA